MSILHIEQIMVNHVIENIASFNLHNQFDVDLHVQYPGGPSKQPNNLPWISLHNTTIGNFDKDANSSGHMTRGIFTININYPPLQGTASVNITADAIVNFFYTTPPDGIYLIDVIARPVFSAQWTSVNVIVSYDYPSDSNIGGTPVYMQ